MARLTHTWTATVTVEHRLFIISGVHTTGEPSVLLGDLIAAPYPPSSGPDPDRGDVGWLFIQSAATSHDAHIDIQLWDSRPDLAAEGWEAVTEVRGDCPDGHIKVGQLTGAPDDVDLPLPAGHYRIAVFARGRQAVRQAVDAWEDALMETDEDLDPPAGVEHYLIQVSPGN